MDSMLDFLESAEGKSEYLTKNLNVFLRMERNQNCEF